MNISVEKLTDESLLRRACDATRRPGVTPSTVTLRRMYQCEHSPIRTQIFLVDLDGVATFVSVHLARHSQGVSHYVQSNRDDRGGDTEVNRLTPVRHLMICNAQALINMARKRLCYASHKTTVGVFARVRNAVRRVDPDLADHMVPECVVRGYCPELRPCNAGPAQVIRAYKDAPHVQARAELPHLAQVE
jgi:hypothetical protein